MTIENQMNTMLTDYPHIVLEMTHKPDCQFIGSWLVKVAEAQSFLSQTLRDPAFATPTSTMCCWSEPNLECAALEALSALRQGEPPFHSYNLPLL